VPPLVLRVVYGSEKKTWLEEQVKAFTASGPTTASGRPIRVEAKAMGSGESVQAIARGELQPHVYSPASSAYLPLLDRAWLGTPGRTKGLVTGGDPLVLSPVVIAMWKPMAEALGWPAKSIGWSDLLSVHASRKGWEAFGRPEWGAFKLGHTHPEFSNSGLLSVLAEAYAGAGKTRGLTVKDLDAKSTRGFVEKVESAIVHYGQSTGFFAEKMRERGPAYLSAAILYENLVIESYRPGGAAAAASAQPFPLVAIYPREGTFWSDHPYAILDAPWVGADERDAAQQLQAFLRARPAQERALALGFRPADPSIPISAPVDAAHGVDPKQPQTLLEVPPADVLEKLLDVWRMLKKTADVVLVFDKSGSMAGEPLVQAKQGAARFVDTLSDRDDLTILFFDNKVLPPVGPLRVGEHRADLLRRIDDVVASGGTALYDASVAAHALALERAQREPGRIHAVVVMTDGKDEHSKLSFEEVRRRLAPGEGAEVPVKIFTIAYGERAEKQILSEMAESAQGRAASGSSGDIVAVYREMGAFF
jgi:Ca-activated chloride channel family protein